MTKSVHCRIIESRPLETVDVVTGPDPSDPHPENRIAVFRRQQAQQAGNTCPKRYSVEKPVNPAAPRGLWIDLRA